MGQHTNCEATTRRDCLRLGLGALIGGGAPSGAEAAAGGGLDIGSIIGQIVSGGVGGGILMIIVGLVKQAMGKT